MRPPHAASPVLHDDKKTAPAPMRKVLVIAFYFPPDNSSTGVLRTAKFTQYLVRREWASEVISVPTERYLATDTQLAAQLPAVVRTTRVWAPDLSKTLSIMGRYPSAATFPDRYWPWLFPAVKAGLKLIRESGIDVIYATSPVPTALWIGMRLKKLTGLPLVIDFRDPWVDNSVPPVRRFFESWLERRFMRSADRIICNTPALRRDFLARYPEVPPERFVTITNGYDEPDFKGIESVPAERFEIIYAGMLQKEHRNPEPLLRAVRLALDRGWLRKEDLHLSFLGTDAWGGSDEFTGRLRELQLDDVTEVATHRIPYRDALRRMAAASVLLVLLHGEGGSEKIAKNREWWGLTVPAKVYEYLRIGRPMLVLVDEGAVAELLRDTGAGTPIPPHDIEAIARTLQRLYDDWRNAPQPRTAAATVSEVVRRYSREALTERLADELDAVAGSAR